METMLRHWTLLRAIPRQPRKADARSLTDQLRDEGFDVSRRTVERDLNKLSALFPLISDDATTGRGWSWLRDADAFDVPGMDPETALTFQILQRFATHLLPRSVLRRLQPQLQQSEAILEELRPESGPRAWPDRVRVLPKGIDLHAPEIAPDVIEVVYRALLEGQRIEADYRPRVAGGETLKTYEINPLGLVFRDQVAYLVCTLWAYEDIRQLALHRFERAELLESARAEPEGFDLDAYIAAGHFHIRESGETLALRARFNSDAAYHLYETPLATDQQLTPSGDGRVELTATVLDTQQLRWWLLGFGAAVEVVAPESLRAELAGEARRMAGQYGASIPQPAVD
ncbi:MAG: helix-turn-helix transcriptional regulator [Halofilum sp. (in: g-proteobacteria)]